MLTVQNLEFAIADTQILRDLSFTLDQGEIVGFVGNNGAGKTTTLELLSQCLRPTAGEILLDGVDIWTSTDHRKRLGYVPDQLPLYPNATVRENLYYAAELRSVDAPQKRVDELITQFALSNVERHPVRTLSKGWRQWIAIAQAWCHKPKLLLLDEPTSGLDPSGRQRFEAWLRHIRSEGTTIFFSSHILSEVEAVSDRILWIEEGQLIAGSELIWTIHCTVENYSPRITVKLQQIEGVDRLQLDGNHITLSCHPNLRSAVSSALVEFGLLDMRRIR